MANDLNIILGAMLDTTKSSKQALNAQIAELQKGLKPLRLKIDFESDVFKQLQTAIAKLGKIEVPVTSGGAEKIKDELQEISKEQDKVIKKFKKMYLKNKEDFEAIAKSVKKANVSGRSNSQIIDANTGKVIKDNDTINQQWQERGKLVSRVVKIQRSLDEDGNPLRGTISIKETSKIKQDIEHLEEYNRQFKNLSDRMKKYGTVELLEDEKSTHHNGVKTVTTKFFDSSNKKVYEFTRQIDEVTKHTLDNKMKVYGMEVKIAKEKAEQLKKEQEILNLAEKQAYAEKARREKKQLTDEEKFANVLQHQEKAFGLKGDKTRHQYGNLIDEKELSNAVNIVDKLNKCVKDGKVDWNAVTNAIKESNQQIEILKFNTSRAKEEFAKIEKEAWDENARRNKQLSEQQKFANVSSYQANDFDLKGNKFSSKYNGFYNEQELKDILNIQQRLNKLVEEYGYDWDKIQAEIRNSNQRLKLLEHTASQAKKEFDEMRMSSNKMADGIKRYATQFAVWETMAMGQFAVRDMVNNVIELDDSLVQLKKVTDETDETYNNFLNTSFEVAGQLGVTTKEFIDASSEWARTGASIDDITNNLAKASTVYSKVGDGITTVDATKVLISTMQGFNLEAEKAIGIVDVLNNVSNKYAVSSDGLGEILKRSASSMNLANTSLEETVALGTTAHIVVQDAESIGNALKTMSMRMRGVKDIDGELTPNLEGLIKDIAGVDMRDATGEIRSMYDVLYDISLVFNDLGSLEQGLLVEKLAGCLFAPYVEKSA